MNYKIKVKTIYYLDDNNEMNKFYAGYNQRLSKEKAGTILRMKRIKYNTILKVIGETIDVTLEHDVLVEGVYLYD